MPADFDKCRAAGGKIRTITGPGNGLKKDEYAHVCVDSFGKSHKGYTKKAKSQRYINKGSNKRYG